jgi:hypothetical protein
MCNPLFNPRLSPANPHHVQELQDLYPKQSEFIQDIYSAMTKGLAPQVNLLVMFTLLRHQYQQNARGILSEYNLLYVPLSIVAKTAKMTWTRFRPKSVKELHTAFLSFMMAETNRVAVNSVCGKYGLAMGQAHCCGVLFGSPEDIREFQKSRLYALRNFLRSAIESLAMPVEEVSFEEIPEKNIDLGISEREFFELYDQTLGAMTLPGCSHGISDGFMQCVDDAWESVIEVTPVAALEYA